MRPVAAAIEQALLAANPLVLPLALVCGLVLALVALSLMMMGRVRVTARAVLAETRAECEKSLAGVETLREELNRLRGQVAELQQGAAAVQSPKGTINWNRRSQVLRLHRRGDDAAGIAATLGVPLQEVDLTVKVHNIVMKNIG
jgi:hypothetical protein